MPLGDIESVRKLLEVMAQAERSIAALYRACMEMDQANAEFWSTLEKQEMTHAENITKMADILLRKPAHFQLGRPFSIAAVETFRKGLDSSREKVKSGVIPKEKFLFLARDNEQSILEQRYQEVLRTTDIEYQTAVDGIVRETVEHKRQIEDRIAETPRA